MRQLLLVAILASAAGTVTQPAASGSYLFVWAGDAAGKGSDFLGVIDADRSSSTYAAIVASVPVGQAGTHPHHTEQEMPASGHLLANGFGAGRTWLFDLTQPLRPRVLTSFDGKGGFSHPHSYVRLANGEVLATYQYAAAGQAPSAHAHGGAPAAGTPAPPAPAPGGLVLMDERGGVIRSGAARDASIAYRGTHPYHVLPLPDLDRAISTTTDMDERNTAATSEWIQVWRLSDLTLLKSFALPPGPRGDEHQYTGELRLLPDGKSAYVHTFNCGLYLLRDLDAPQPRATFVRSFPGTSCGVPVLVGHHWLQPVPDSHALVALDISDPQRPRETSSVSFGDDEAPHWVAADSTGRRLVMNSGGKGAGNRLFVIDFDPATGALTIDPRFRDPGSDRPGVALTGRTWPHGFSGKAVPHGTVFSK